MYNGIAPALLGSGVAWGLYWMFYENAKARHQRSLGEGERLATMQHLASSCEAGVICVLITHPIWLLKTRLQLQTLTPAQAAGAASDLPLEQRPYRVSYMPQQQEPRAVPHEPSWAPSDCAGARRLPTDAARPHNANAPRGCATRIGTTGSHRARRAGCALPGRPLTLPPNERRVWSTP